MFPEPITPCRCESAGLCSRHQCEKTYAWVLACRLDWQMFQRWENGEGPCVGQIRAIVNGEAPPPEPLAELPACRHRGAEPLEFVDCELCGGRNERVPLYSCACFGKCTPRRYGTRTEVMRKMPSCIRCDKYEAAESTSPDTSNPAFSRETQPSALSPAGEIPILAIAGSLNPKIPIPKSEMPFASTNDLTPQSRSNPSRS